MRTPASSRPPGRPRRADAALNYARILETARRMLAQDPDVPISEIASAVGLGRGTIYRHFPDREALLSAVRSEARDAAEADQDDRLRPAGELAGTRRPLSVTDVLNKVPPFQLGEQIVAEALRIAGVTSAALYLVDLDGLVMLRLAGPGTFPGQLDVPLAVGPEIPRDGITALRASIERQLPGAEVAPLFLRGRAVGALLSLGTADDELRDLAADAAAALCLAEVYTDAIDTVRRVRRTSPAAEIQQNLLPPRIVRIGGARLAGNVLPGYEIGGDWFDYAENADGAWLGIADVQGTGPRAAGLGAVILGAFRSARHQHLGVADAAQLMHDVLIEVRMHDAVAAATIGCWNAATATFRWVTFGRPTPVVISEAGELTVLDGALPLLGSPELTGPFELQHRRLEIGDRLLLVSDGITERRDPRGRPFGFDGVLTAGRRADPESAAATVRAIEDAVRTHCPGSLEDDASVVCLAR